MSKIRINELARQLEVKSREVIEKLHELGVDEKVTHSSSIDDDTADKLRRYYAGDGSVRVRPPRASSEFEHDEDSEHAWSPGDKAPEDKATEAPVTAAVAPPVVVAPVVETAEKAPAAKAAAEKAPAEKPPVAPRQRTAAPVARPAEPVAAAPVTVAAPEAPVVAESKEPAKEKEPEEDHKPRAIPLRPPLLGRGSPIQPPMGPRPSALPLGVPVASARPPVAPVAPPVRPPQENKAVTPPAPVSAPAAVPGAPMPGSALPGLPRPAPVRPAGPARPPAPPVSAPQQPSATPGRPVPPPARPIPTGAPRPGQILSGPRQPMPPSMPSTAPRPAGASPGAPPPVSMPGSAPSVRPGVPIGPPPRPAGFVPGAPRPPQPNRPMAGQPVARPIVPPRPDLVAKLGQQQRSPMPGQAPPRPTVPLRPQPPRPGQPLYQGPPRPGAPSSMPQRGARPGMPGPGAPRPGGPRPMHPTSRAGSLIGPGTPPPPSDQAARRPQQQYQRTSRGGPQGRRKEAEEKVLRPTMRRELAPPPINRDITISEGITVKELSEKLDVKANFVIKKLVDRGIFATINQTLDAKLATDISREFGASTSTVTYEEEAMQVVEVAEADKDLVRRPPVVTIMGHVDHGKTSLLDAIRVANVAGREAGGITQHIGAYHVEKNGNKIVFIDTPGHEAFTRMRSRGAKVTDIVVLVVAADDGVMPQTLEAIDHARAAKVPIIVAINKIDKADAQVDRIKQQLSDRGLLAEDWGGDTVMVPVSARTKTNLDLLLEMILLVAEIQDLKANPARPAMATVLEAKLDRGRGPVATVLVRNGTLRVGDNFICGVVFGRVRAMINDQGAQVKEVGPSMPVEVLGLEQLPEAGDSFQVVTDTAKAKQIVLYRAEKERAASLAKGGRITLEQFHKQMAAGEVKELPIILKADVAGSAEVLRDTLERLSTDKVTIRVLRAGVGAINESDVDLAVASNAIVIGFNVRPERNAVATAEREKVDMRLHTIIYEVMDEMKKAMAGMLAPVYKEIYRGRAEVREVFKVSKIGAVAGCLVVDGNIPRDSQLRILRDNKVVHTGKVGSLRRFKDDVSEVRFGMECGITIDNYNDLHQGDVIEAFAMQRVAVEAA
jgi:translation initiation factor IF-2